MARLLQRITAITHGWLPSWVQALILFALVSAVLMAVHRVLLHFLEARPQGWRPFLRNVAIRTRRLIGYMILLFAAASAMPLMQIPATARDDVRRIFLALFIVQLGWIAMVIANIAIDRYVYGFKLDTADNLLARKAVTQMRIVRQAVTVMLGLLTIGFALMSFDSVRQFGISLFASAGMAGIVAGLAARPLLENLVAGLQLAFTQPLRMGDAVVINNEFGTVEEITSVYIVVKLWDWRRQVVPLSYLFTTPFVNWTRSSSSIIGSVFLFTDYTMDVDRFRAEAERVVKTSPLWDGQVINTQVIDTTEQTMKIRVLISAADSGRASDLGSFMREKMILFLRRDEPSWLPRTRQEPIVLPPPRDAAAPPNGVQPVAPSH